MKLVSEYRDRRNAERLATLIDRVATRPWTLMEVCGGQTHSIVRYGIDELLPKRVRLVHGPGCPVCVTPAAWIDKAVAVARTSNVVLCSFGDMLRVPGTKENLLAAKASGGDVRVVYSPLDAVDIAARNPTKEVVFFAVGFETTAPATAMAVAQAKERAVGNFSMLVCHVLVPPAMETLLRAPDNEVQGFLAAGHVCTVMGYSEYEPIARDFKVPIVVTGFEPLDILEGVYLCVRQLEDGKHEVENQYRRAVRRSGNEEARHLVARVFEPCLRHWRGLGEIAQSGLRLRDEYRALDAEERFGRVVASDDSNVEPVTECIAGLILRGTKIPADCPAFGSRCRPERPLGAPMVSSEGACAAYFQYRRQEALR